RHRRVGADRDRGAPGNEGIVAAAADQCPILDGERIAAAGRDNAGNAVESRSFDAAAGQNLGRRKRNAGRTGRGGRRVGGGGGGGRRRRRAVAADADTVGVGRQR